MHWQCTSYTALKAQCRRAVLTRAVRRRTGGRRRRRRRRQTVWESTETAHSPDRRFFWFYRGQPLHLWSPLGRWRRKINCECTRYENGAGATPTFGRRRRRRADQLRSVAAASAKCRWRSNYLINGRRVICRRYDSAHNVGYTRRCSIVGVFLAAARNCAKI